MPHNSFFQRKYLILNMIHHLGPISRTELAELTDYRLASIGAIVKELLEEKAIVESSRFFTGHGRKRVMLELNREYLCAMGISFAEDRVIYVVSAIGGTVLKEDFVTIEPEISREELVEEIVTHAGQLQRIFSDRQMVGIGISEPLNDPAKYQFMNLTDNHIHINDWVHLKLKPRLETLSGLNVEVYSNVAMPATAERQFGMAKGLRDFIWIELSNGIGASICCNGLPVTGGQGRAAEIGHTVIDYRHTAENICYCGKAGCVEHRTAYPALQASLKRALDRGVYSALKDSYEKSGRIRVPDIRQALEMGDQLCLYMVKDVASCLGAAIANAVNLLNPEMVVLFGFMLELGDAFLEPLKTSIRENVFLPLGSFEICVSKATDSIFSQGAAAEIFSSYLKSGNYQWVYELSYDPGEVTTIDNILL